VPKGNVLGRNKPSFYGGGTNTLQLVPKPVYQKTSKPTYFIRFISIYAKTLTISADFPKPLKQILYSTLSAPKLLLTSD